MDYLILADKENIKFCIESNYKYSYHSKSEFVSKDFIFIGNDNIDSFLYKNYYDNKNNYSSFYEDTLKSSNQINNDKYIRPVESLDISDLNAASINPSIDSVQIAKADLFYQVFTNNNPENIISSLSDLGIYELKDKSNIEIEHIVSNANRISFFLRKFLCL